MADSTPLCPRCRVPIFEGRARAAKLLGCGECGGVWLDNAATRAVVEGEAQDLSALAEQASRHARVPIDATAAILPCPVCGQTMTRVVATAATIELDVCTSHGTWFDANELRVVAVAYARLPSAAIFQEAYPDEEAQRRYPKSFVEWLLLPSSDPDPMPRRDDHHFEEFMDWFVRFVSHDDGGTPPPW